MNKKKSSPATGNDTTDFSGSSFLGRDSGPYSNIWSGIHEGYSRYKEGLGTSGSDGEDGDDEEPDDDTDDEGGQPESLPSSVTPTAPSDQPAQPATPTQPETPKQPLLGGGWHDWVTSADPDTGDIRAKGYAGPSFTAPPNTPGGHGVYIPMGKSPGTQGSPFPPMPDGTLVTVKNPQTGQSITVPVIGDGSGTDMVHMTKATQDALGMASPGIVEMRVIGGAGYVKPPQVFTPPPDPTHVTPDDGPTITAISQKMPRAYEDGWDSEPVKETLMSLKSGMFGDLPRRAIAELDAYEKTDDDELEKKHFANALKIIDQINAMYRESLRKKTSMNLPTSVGGFLSA